MKTLRRLCTVFVLTLVLALSAFAGDISTTVVSQPSPPPESQVSTTGDMSTGFTGEMTTGAAAMDSTTEVALNLLQSLLSLF